MPVEWMDRAACADTPNDLWFPDDFECSRPDWGPARKVCGGCPVRSECLEFALGFPEDRDRHGMFGGLTPLERGQVRYDRLRARSSK
jgi:WhiB family redox-sensing transcriptional regulator